MHRRDITIVRGDLYTHVLEFTDDPTLFTYRAQLRLDPMASGTPDLVFAVDETLKANKLVILSAEPEVTAELDPTVTYRWTVEQINPDGDPESLMGGVVTIEQKVSAA